MTKKWYEHACIYEIFINSFRDGNFDGYGDIIGILEKVNLLSLMRFDALLLSPLGIPPTGEMEELPPHDRIDPAYGDDFQIEHLAGMLQERGMRLMLDLIPTGDLAYAADYWISRGVEGFRLGGTPSHELTRDFRKHLDDEYGAGVCPVITGTAAGYEEARSYFGTEAAPESNVCANFSMEAAILAAAGTGDATPVKQFAKEMYGGLPKDAAWAHFLRYKDGAVRRFAPLLGADKKKVMAMAALLASLPGPMLWYYGDELLLADEPELAGLDAVRQRIPWDYMDEQAQKPDSFVVWLSQTLESRRMLPGLLGGELEVLDSEPHILRFVRKSDTSLSTLFQVNFSTFDYFWEYTQSE
jgi:glycosidase